MSKNKKPFDPKQAFLKAIDKNQKLKQSKIQIKAIAHSEDTGISHYRVDYSGLTKNLRPTDAAYSMLVKDENSKKPEVTIQSLVLS